MAARRGGSRERHQPEPPAAERRACPRADARRRAPRSASSDRRPVTDPGTGVLPGPGPFLPDRGRPDHRRAPRRTRHRIRSCPRATPRLAPRAASRLVIGPSQVRWAPGAALLGGVSRLAAPAPPVARLLRITGPGRQLDIVAAVQAATTGLAGWPATALRRSGAAAGTGLGSTGHRGPERRPTRYNRQAGRRPPGRRAGPRRPGGPPSR